MDMVNKAFIEIMIEGDANGRGFQYPIPTYSITRDFDWSETENNKMLFEMTAKYGNAILFQIISNSDMQPQTCVQCAAACVLTCASCAKNPAVSSEAASPPARLGRHHKYSTQ
jgi:anaerobic ribonucleoside-triphosphate reductase